MTPALELEGATIQIEENATARIRWNEEQQRFDIAITLVEENHKVDIFGWPERGITTMERAEQLARDSLFGCYADYHELVMSRW